MSTFVFHVTKAINEFDAPVGSYVVYRPGHATAEVQIVRTVKWNERVADLLKRSDRLQLVHQDPPVQVESPFHIALRDHQTRQLG